MTPRISNSQRSNLAGEVWVWLCGMGLTVGLMLIAVLLGIIAFNGLRVFWPKPVVLITMTESGMKSSRSELMGGIIQGSRERMIPRPEGRTAEREWHIQMGNRERHGVSFRYVPSSEIASLTFPPDAIVLERVEYGPAVGFPEALLLNGHSPLTVDAPLFATRLSETLHRVRSLREQIRRVEKYVIGGINFRMEQLRLQERKAAAQQASSQSADFANQRAALQAEYDQAAAEARRMRSELQHLGSLRLRYFSGETADLPLGNLLYAHYPNRMSLGEKWRHFLKGMVRFLVEEPREANTEGGIFPALFGTFVMTLLMSIAVMPFGVLAAIYLREYARPGLLVRLVRISVNNLAGVPSIVFGVFGLGFFVYTVGGSIDRLFYSAALPTPTFGTGGVLWASLTLALMTVPVVIVATEEALAAVPRSMRDGSLALGASKWQTIYRVVLSAAAPGIMTGLILAMARGAGEVAPLMLVGVVKLAPSLPVDGIFPFIHLERKFMHLGFHIYDLGFQSPDSDAAKPMVFATTLFLILLVVVLNLGALIIRERLRRKYATGAF